MSLMKDTLPDGLYQPRAFARSSDPSTSKRAAAGVKVNPLELQVLKVLEEYGPLNTKQIADKAGIDPWSISPRMKPLEKKGRIERMDTGERLTKWRIKSE